MIAIVLAFACCLIFSVFYWQVAHAVLSKALRFKLFAIRDEARRFAVENNAAAGFAFCKVEKLINNAIKFGPHISLTSFAWFAARSQNFDDSDIHRFESEAPEKFKELRDMTAKVLVIIMMLNSLTRVKLSAKAIRT